MKISYRNANPGGGNESVVLAFEDGVGSHTPCLLVDAGAGVDLDELLDDDEYLAAVLLTHAHLDHYQSLGDAVRDGAPVFASPATGRILEAVLEEGRRHYDLDRTDAVLEALDPVSDWTTVVEGLRVVPVPAGHAPGAAGFRIAVDDGPETHSILVTGDFTTRRAAGYPGLDPEAHADADALVLTGATDDRFEDQLTHTVGTAVARARAGSTVLVTASGLQGTHLAYVLGQLVDRYDLRTRVTLAGHVARLYDDLGYDVPSVETVRTFSDPGEVLAPGTIAVAGPEVPVDGSAGRLFEAIEDDPGATLVQATNGGTDPVDAADCTVAEYDLRNHPAEAIVDQVVEAVDPLELVVTHQRGSGLDRYKDKYTSFVWATDDEARHVLYDDQFLAPPWMTDVGVRRVRSAHYGSNGTSAEGVTERQSLDRRSEPKLDCEGLRFDVLVEEYHLNEDRATPARPGTDGSGTTGAAGTDGSGTTGAARGHADAGNEPAGRAERGRDGSEEGTHAATLDRDAIGAIPDGEAIADRLAGIERAVTGETVRARVVDDDELLLRLLGPGELADDLDYGDEVEVVVRTGEEG